MKLDLLQSSELAVFATRDFARLAHISVPAASKQLGRLARTNRSLVQLTRGIWANTAHPHFNSMACVPVLLGSEQGYISFLSALHLHGAISQIPANIQVATTGHTRKARTPIGTFEFLQLKPEMFLAGIEWSDTPRPYRIAGPEKALLDTLYISTRKNRRFAKLPELNLADANLNPGRFKSLLKELVASPQILAAIESRSDSILSKCK